MRELSIMLNRAAETWFQMVFHVTWQASLLAVVLLGVVLLGRRWPSPLRYGLLVLALAKFALPPLASLPTGLFSRVAPPIEQRTPEANVATIANASSDWTTASNPLWNVPAPSVSQGPAMEQATPPVPPAAPGLDGYAWLMILHLAGGLAATYGFLRSLLAMRRVVRCATTVAQGETYAQFVRLSEQLGLRRPPRLLLSNEPCGPAAFGVFRPLVILPATMASLPTSELDVILAHELAHHRRRDLWINAIQLALTAIWWFNPVLWVLNRQIRKVREDCCDDLLLTRNITTGKDYCGILLSAASKLAGRQTASVALGFGDRLHPLGRRFERIMDRTLRRAPRLSVTGILVLVVLAGVMLPGLRRSEGEEPANEPAPQLVADVEAPKDWPEGTTVTGRVLDHRGQPVVNAEVLLLGKERIIVEGDTRTWFNTDKALGSPASSRTDKAGAFTMTRQKGVANRLGIIADELLFWVVPRAQLPGNSVEIKLPEAGSIKVQCNFPGKPAKQGVHIEWRHKGQWDSDWLRFHGGSNTAPNPGERVFKHLPPGRYTVQCLNDYKVDEHSSLISFADLHLADVKANALTTVRLERKSGRTLTGHVRGLENVELRVARISVQGWGPDEGTWEKPSRRSIDIDIVPVAADGQFTIPSIPPGEYRLHLYAIRASTPRLSPQPADFSGQMSFTVPEQGDLPKVELIAKANKPVDLSTIKDPRLRVIDEDGKPLPKFQAMYHTADQGYGRWVEGRDGLVVPGIFRRDGDRGSVDILVRADGYAPAVAHFEDDQWAKLRSGEATVTLRRGQKVELRFKLPAELAWPRGTLPEACFDVMQQRVRMMRQPSNRRGDTSDFNMLNLREISPGRFECWLAHDTPRFHVAVHAPGFLQNYEAGSFSFADAKQGVLEMDVPRPATLAVSFVPGEHAANDGPFKFASLNVMCQLQGNSYLIVASSEGNSLTPMLKLTDLAPGHYLIGVRTQPKNEAKAPPGETINEGVYNDQTKLTLKAGQSERIDFRSTAYDPNAFRGNRTAVVRIRTPDGKPAKDRKASIRYFDGHYGSLNVYSGPVPASGEIVLSGITDMVSLQSSYGPYDVRVEDKHVGFFRFTKETPSQEFEFALAPAAGDIAPDVELTRLETGEAVRLSSLRGKLVFLEFWATWCGPCQEPMAKLNALADEQIPAWKDRVAIVPVSIDSERARAKTHVQQRGWSKLNHFWAGGGSEADFDSPAARAFVVSGVPEAFLIGPDGRILWRGHPLEKFGGKDAKARIEDALR